MPTPSSRTRSPTRSDSVGPSSAKVRLHERGGSHAEPPFFVSVVAARRIGRLHGDDQASLDCHHRRFERRQIAGGIAARHQRACLHALRQTACRAVGKVAIRNSPTHGTTPGETIATGSSITDPSIIDPVTHRNTRSDQSLQIGGDGIGIGIGFGGMRPDVMPRYRNRRHHRHSPQSRWRNRPVARR